MTDASLLYDPDAELAKTFRNARRMTQRRRNRSRRRLMHSPSEAFRLMRRLAARGEADVFELTSEPSAEPAPDGSRHEPTFDERMGGPERARRILGQFHRGSENG